MKYIKPIIGMLLGLTYFVFSIYGYPAKWFIHGTFFSLDTPMYIYFVNSMIMVLVVVATTLALGFYKKLESGIFMKYGLLFIGTLFISLIAEFVGHFGDYSYAPSFDLIFFDAILTRFFRNAVEVLSLSLFIKGFTQLEIKYNVLISTILGLILYMSLMIIIHRTLYVISVLYYASKGVGMGALVGYLVSKENAMVTPAIFFGFIGITGLPNYFAMNGATQPSTMIVMMSLYFIIGIAFIFACIYPFIPKRKKEEIKEA